MSPVSFVSCGIRTPSRAGTTWHDLARPGTSWHTMAHHGTPWHTMCHGVPWCLPPFGFPPRYLSKTPRKGGGVVLGHLFSIAINPKTYMHKINSQVLSTMVSSFSFLCPSVARNNTQCGLKDLTNETTTREHHVQLRVLRRYASHVYFCSFLFNKDLSLTKM